MRLGRGGRTGRLLTVIAEFTLVDDTTLSLPGDVGHPDAAYVDAVLATCMQQVLP